MTEQFTLILNCDMTQWQLTAHRGRSLLSTIACVVLISASIMKWCL